MGKNAQADDALRAAVNDEPPASIAQLPTDAQRQLAKVLEDSRLQQQARLQKSLKDALNHLPRLLRGPVRRVLFPKGDI